MKQRVNDQIERVFRPEFINRFNDIIVFRHLSEKDLEDVVDLELKKLRVRLKERNLCLKLTEEAKKLIIKRGSNLDYGARPLRRAIESNLEDPLSEEILKGEFDGKDVISVEVRTIDDKKSLCFKGEKFEELTPEELELEEIKNFRRDPVATPPEGETPQETAPPSVSA